MQITFGEQIIHWYHHHKRDLPWRHTTDPYKIWLSEIILQQTRVEQGLDYYNRFVSKFPDVHKLARAKEGEVLKLWQGLGYYSRARNLHHAAKDILNRFKGTFPSAHEDIRSLKGIGAYTAAAISSFAFNNKHAAVDGNVFRVLSRYLGIKTPVNTGKAKREFYDAAMQLMDGSPPADFNQAIMEFGALHCKPQNPGCGICPLSQSCFAFAKNKVDLFPVKGKKTAARNRYFNYLFIRHGNTIYMRKRTGTDIWKNLYDFPMIETSKKISTENLLKLREWETHFAQTGYHLLSVSKSVTHRLSHQTIHAKFYEVKTFSKIKIPGSKPFHAGRIGQFAMPKLIENFLEESGLN